MLEAAKDLLSSRIELWKAAGFVDKEVLDALERVVELHPDSLVLRGAGSDLEGLEKLEEYLRGGDSTSNRYRNAKVQKLIDNIYDLGDKQSVSNPEEVAKAIDFWDDMGSEEKIGSHAVKNESATTSDATGRSLVQDAGTEDAQDLIDDAIDEGRNPRTDLGLDDADDMDKWIGLSDDDFPNPPKTGKGAAPAAAGAAGAVGEAAEALAGGMDDDELNDMIATFAEERKAIAAEQLADTSGKPADRVKRLNTALSNHQRESITKFTRRAKEKSIDNTEVTTQISRMKGESERFLKDQEEAIRASAVKSGRGPGSRSKTIGSMTDEELREQLQKGLSGKEKRAAAADELRRRADAEEWKQLTPEEQQARLSGSTTRPKGSAPPPVPKQYATEPIPNTPSKQLGEEAAAAAAASSKQPPTDDTLPPVGKTRSGFKKTGNVLYDNILDAIRPARGTGRLMGRQANLAGKVGAFARLNPGLTALGGGIAADLIAGMLFSGARRMTGTDERSLERQMMTELASPERLITRAKAESIRRKQAMAGLQADPQMAQALQKQLLGQQMQETGRVPGTVTVGGDITQGPFEDPRQVATFLGLINPDDPTSQPPLQ
jgi:hypothetical protein